MHFIYEYEETDTDLDITWIPSGSAVHTQKMPDLDLHSQQLQKHQWISNISLWQIPFAK